jgi:hypothetical protein
MCGWYFGADLGGAGLPGVGLGLLGLPGGTVRPPLLPFGVFGLGTLLVPAVPLVVVGAVYWLAFGVEGPETGGADGAAGALLIDRSSGVIG